MSRLTPERRRRAQFGRTVMGVSALFFMIMSAVLPHILVESATVLPGRSLIPATHFFLIANPNAEAFQDATSVADAGMGISIQLPRPGLSADRSDHWPGIVLGAHR